MLSRLSRLIDAATRCLASVSASSSRLKSCPPFETNSASASPPSRPKPAIAQRGDGIRFSRPYGSYASWTEALLVRKKRAELQVGREERVSQLDLASSFLWLIRGARRIF